MNSSSTPVGGMGSTGGPPTASAPPPATASAAGTSPLVAAAVPGTATSPADGVGPVGAESLLVEVQGENSAYYKAFVTDVFDTEVLLRFEEDWQPQSRFPFNRVRLPPSTVSSADSFTVDQEIEVYSRASDQESCGWWRAVIKMIKGEFHVVEYLGWETTYTEIVPIERLRVKSSEPGLTARYAH